MDKNEKNWLDVFDEEFLKESDRASVILSATMLDNALETLLRTYLVPIGSQQDNLLEGRYAPIYTFSARIDLAHRIGLISTKLCRDLHMVRRIRNEFSHNVTGCDFNNQSISDRIAELKRSMVISKGFSVARQSLPKGPRGDFQWLISWILFDLKNSTDKVTSLKPKGEERILYEKLPSEEGGSSSD